MTTQDELKANGDKLVATLETLDVESLVALVRHHNAAYWSNNAPEIDDQSYDALVEALRVRDPQAAVLDELEGQDGLDRRFASVTHARPMLSLEKCYDDDTLEKWREKIRGAVVVTPKIDGMACSLRYDSDGKLVVAATRGDGKVGDDVTVNAGRVREIPTSLDKKLVMGTPLEVRGEVYMRLSRFRDVYAKDFANPRNLTAGALKQKEADKSASYELSFFAYDVDGTALETEREKAQHLLDLGFCRPPTLVIEPNEDLAATYRHFLDERDAFDFETDGVVMKADSVQQQAALGYTAHHPRYAIAYKFQGESAHTTLLGVEWSLGRTGAITPVALVAPVVASGATVSRASLHHAGYIAKLGLSLGARVEIVRRGGVIPKLERVLAPGSTPIEIPALCPSCQKPTTREDDFLFCPEPDACPDVTKNRVGYFLKSIDVVGLGERTLHALLERELVKTPADVFRLTMENLTDIDRLGEKTAKKILAEIDAKRALPFPTFLSALGIDEVGPTVSETLSTHFETLPRLREADATSLAEIHGIGPSIAGALIDGLSRSAHEIDDLLTVVTIVAPAAPLSTDHALSGKSVVFTGKMAHLDRKRAQIAVKERGGKTPSSVTADLDYLVIGDDGSPLLGDGEKSTKHKAAEKLIAKGSVVSIITETAFLEMVGGV